MSDLNIEPLLQPLAAERPCGEDLSYDPDFMELERLIQGTPEREMGDVKIAAEEPDWRDISRRCQELLARTRDLRIMVYLTLAELKLRGAPGFRDGIVLIQKSLESFWPTLYPALDPDDNNDPTFRVNAIAAMSPQGDVYGDILKFPDRLRSMVLADSKQIGRICLRDILISRGELTPPEGEEKKDPGIIDAAFKSANPESVALISRAIDESIAAWDAMDAALTAHVPPDHAVDLQGSRKILSAIQAAMRHHMGAAENKSSEASAASSGGSGASAASAAVAQAMPHKAGGFSVGSIASRADCNRAIDEICRFLEATEPSSPVPLLLKRAQRLIDKNFIDVISDLSPDTLAAIRALAGLAKEGE
ncbi:MAG: type VI secretion system protein TssA [Phycisphaerae bacterium]